MSRLSQESEGFVFRQATYKGTYVEAVESVRAGVSISAILLFCHSFCHSAIPAIPAIRPFRLPFNSAIPSAVPPFLPLFLLQLAEELHQ
jgi:hypothetical protein